MVSAQSRFHMLLLMLCCLGAAACKDNDEITGETHGAPVNARLFLNNQELTQPIPLTRNQVTRLEVRFFDASGSRITGIDDHKTKLTFAPATIATVVDVSGQPFQRDVTAQAAVGVTGTVSVGYGHTVAADERTFGPLNVVVR
jgi:hypothetical protein